MATPRYGHTATLLRDGRVLIAGGFDGQASNKGLASAELYDPTTRTFGPTGSMTYARVFAAATLLPDGRVLVAGGAAGMGSAGGLASAEIYDPSRGTFNTTGSMASAREFPTATLLPDGRVLIVGGQSGGTGMKLASAELYDSTTGTFSPTGSMTSARVTHTATLLSDGHVLIVGGESAAPGSNLNPLASAELYDPSTGKFRKTGSMKDPRFGHTATLLPDGRVLVAGGLNSGSIGVNKSAELYTPDVGKFQPTGWIDGGWAFGTATALPNGRVLIAGGRFESQAEPFDWLYDPLTGRFIDGSPMISAHVLGTATPITDGRVLIVGGDGRDDRPVASAELYQP
jgi:hypothetical protein